MAKKIKIEDIVPIYDTVPTPHMYDKAPSQKIIKLGRKITDVAAHKLFGVKVSDPEYWGLAEILSEDMADVGLSMKLRTPYTFSEMCELNPEKAKDKEAFKKLLDDMLYVGLLEFDYGNHYDHNGRNAPQTEKRYILAMFVPGSAEMFNMEETPDCINRRLIEHPAVASFFERMTYLPLAKVTQMVPPGGAGVGMHVIPVEEAIKFENESVDLEHLSYWLKKYKDKIGVGQCSCRSSRQALGEGCGDDNYGWCIGVGDFADYCRETGKGHDITYEEAMEILKKAEENGFVHQITNIDGENKIFGICNCNVNICNALRTSQLFNTPNMSRSAYTAKVDPSKCVACGRCVEYCPAGAVKLGQKLCTKQGEIVYPRHELPDNKIWGPDKWDPDYRDNNRINCYDTGTAPCKTMCPAHIAVQGYIKMAKEGRYGDALKLIKHNNPFPAICGHVCYHPCEDACTRGEFDKAVAIDEIKKFVALEDLNKETRYVPKIIAPISPARQVPLDHFKQKIAIIGGGPAGLTCAYFLALKGYKPTVFEKNDEPGGMMVYGIPSFKLEKDVVRAEIEVIKELGVEIKTGVNVSKDITIEELRREGYEAFYIAIGCQGANIPYVDGVDAIGVESAIDLLHKAHENENQKVVGDVVVIGGGNVAVDAVRTLKRFGANPKMVSLETLEEMPASVESIDIVKKEDIEIINSYGPKEILKDEFGHVLGIVLKKCLRTTNLETKKFDPVYDENDTITINCTKVVFATGQKTIWGDLLHGTNVKLNKNYPLADKLTYQTDEKDIFVGGDVYTGPRYVIDAIAQGKEAAVSIHRFVQPNTSLTIGRNRNDYKSLDKNNIVVASYDKTSRQEVGLKEGFESTFRDMHETFTEEQVKKEASRCLSCGMSIVDPNKCIGCGVCTTKCDFDAIHLVRDHPECTHMVRSEDKFKYILPYQAKRALKILTRRKTKEEKEYLKKYKSYQKRVRISLKENSHA